MLTHFRRNMFVPESMLSMFITDQAIVAEGAPMLRVLFTSYIAYGVLILAITFFQAIGKAINAAVLTLLRQVLLFLPLVLLLPLIFAESIQGIQNAGSQKPSVKRLLFCYRSGRPLRLLKRQQVRGGF